MSQSSHVHTHAYINAHNPEYLNTRLAGCHSTKLLIVEKVLKVQSQSIVLSQPIELTSLNEISAVRFMDQMV